MSGWTSAEIPDCTGETVVVTGANSGLGRAATEAFAEAGATVVMACRSRERGERAAAEIRETVPRASLEVRVCDLADLDSVESFAADFRESYDALHRLCNNAGVMAVPRGETEDGFERQLGINHLGHFALTGHLLETLVATSGQTRVVTHSSGAHSAGRIDFEDLQSAASYSKWGAYAQSKLANLLFAFELQRRLTGAGIEDTISVACHPGYADTNLQYRGPREFDSRVRYVLMRVANALLGQSPRQGALPLLYAATAPGVSGGEYYGPGGLLGMRGSPERQAPSERARDEAVAERLWAVSEGLTGVAYDFQAR